MADFDALASMYDDDFTHTYIGWKQRRVVWNYLIKHLEPNLDILELNGGTGEDALFLANKGHKVLTTDRSTEMLKMSCQKLSKSKTKHPVRLKKLDLNHPTLSDTKATFDLVFSNFGGLNCIDKMALQRLHAFVSDRLKPGGALIFVIMPKDTLLEKWYRMWKGQKQAIKARQSEEGTTVSVEGDQVQTYFYNPPEIAEIFKSFSVKQHKITGLIPSYFEQSIQKYKVLFFPIFLLEAILIKTKIFSAWGDHFLIHLEKE